MARSREHSLPALPQPAIRATFLDRAIGYFAPEAGARRLRSRMQIDILSRSYSGAAKGRLTASWKAGPTSADTEVFAAGSLLRDRMRDMVRNNPHAANAVSQLVTHIVGAGIMPRANTGDKAKDKAINALFTEFAKKCDADGQLNFYGLQKLIVRGMIESGDGLVRRRRRLPIDGLPVAVQFQVFETDLLDNSKNGPMPGNHVAVSGIEFDAIGARAAYWLYPAHPGNNFIDPRSATISKAIPAADIAHVYEKQRSQVRGTPWGVSALMDLRDLDGYEEAEIIRKRMESCMVGILVNKADDDTLGMAVAPSDPAIQPGVYDQSGYAVEKFEPGMFAYARGANDIKFNTPASTQSYEAYKRSVLHTIAAGFRVPYSILTGDLTQVNYSSSKVGLEPFRRMISALQEQEIIPMVCQPMWDWFIEAAFYEGKIKDQIVPVIWACPHFYSADPVKDAMALTAEVRGGFRSMPDAIASGGRNPDDVVTEIEEWNAKIDAADVILDTDPRKVSKQGMFQIEADPAGIPGDTGPIPPTATKKPATKKPNGAAAKQ